MESCKLGKGTETHPCHGIGSGISGWCGGLISLSSRCPHPDHRNAVRDNAFQELSQDIREQQLPLGAKESDIHFPDTLTVTLQQTVTIFGKQETESEEETVQESITEEDSENQNRETKETTETQESGENATEESQAENPKAGSTSEDTPQTEKLEVSQEQNQEENSEEQPEEAQQCRLLSSPCPGKTSSPGNSWCRRQRVCILW